MQIQKPETTTEEVTRNFRQPPGKRVKKKVLLLTKIFGLGFFYMLVLVASIFLTMSALIKSDELKAPDFRGKNISDAYRQASEHGLYLKKILGNYGKQYKPLTVINQFPAPGIKIKEKSFIKVFVTSELTEVIMPNLTGYKLRECEKILRENDLRKRYISYMTADEVPVDVVISQSVPAGARIPSGTGIDMLVGKGRFPQNYIMPDLIGKRADRALVYLEGKGLKISQIVPVSYPGLESGVIIKQYPDSGFQINTKARIRLEVSE